MCNKRIEDYIYQRIAELESQKDMQEVTAKGRLSFGVDAARYGRLPAWDDLVKRKKQMVKMVWINAAFVSLTLVGMSNDYFENFGQNWLKALATWLTVSALMMLIYVVWSFYSVFYQFRMTEREVRKLIYQDILHQLKKEEKELV
jgi:hypothetical protein